MGRKTQIQFQSPFQTMSAFYFLLVLFFRPSMANPNSTFSFSFPHFSTKDPKFTSQIALHGDSKLAGASGGSIQLTSHGRVVYKKPIKLIEGKPQKLVSFSTNFSFSLSKGESLAFVMLPSAFDLGSFDNASFGVSHKGKAKIVLIKFIALDEKKIHGGIDVVGLVSSRTRNASTVDLTLKNGTESFAWVDYEASSKRLEVRLSQTSGSKPSDPLFWYPIDLSRTWQNDEALVGFSANSSTTSSVHSWSFEQRHVPQWMHSQPLDPKGAYGVGDDDHQVRHSKPLKIVPEKKKIKSDCLTKILASLIFGVACGASMAFVGLYLWTVFGKKRPVVPEESVDFDYKKVKVVVDNKAIEDDGN